MQQQLHFKDSGVNDNIKEKTIKYTYSTDGSWACETNLAAKFHLNSVQLKTGNILENQKIPRQPFYLRKIL